MTVPNAFTQIHSRDNSLSCSGSNQMKNDLTMMEVDPVCIIYLDTTEVHAKNGVSR